MRFRQLVILLITLILGTTTGAEAQTFTQRLRQASRSGGSITLFHDASIDQLVKGALTEAGRRNNAGKAGKNTSDATPAKTGTKSLAGDRKQSDADRKKDTAADKSDDRKKDTAADKSVADKRGTADEAKEENPDGEEHKTARYRGPMKKVNGYRVQAFAGGSSRADQHKAEAAGKVMKESFPEEAVYVHFKSPRWTCRVGNFTTYEEAHQMLVKVRELGYSSANIVKSKVSVPY